MLGPRPDKFACVGNSEILKAPQSSNDLPKGTAHGRRGGGGRDRWRVGWGGRGGRDPFNGRDDEAGLLVANEVVEVDAEPPWLERGALLDSRPDPETTSGPLSAVRHKWPGLVN